MNSRGFWQDVMRAGAILGIVMALSRVFEQYIMVYSELSLVNVVLIYSIEWLMFAAIYACMLFFNAKRCVELSDPKVGMGFSQVLSYVILVSMFAGVVVGLANTLFVSAMGYELYVDGMLGRIEEMQQMVAAMPVDGMYEDVFAETIDLIRGAKQPTIFQNIFTSLNSYILVGGFVGVIIAAIVRRDATIHINEE